MKRIKKITTLVNENRKVILTKVLVYGGIAGGLILGVLLAKPDEDIIVGEVVDESEPVSDRYPEQD